MTDEPSRLFSEAEIEIQAMARLRILFLTAWYPTSEHPVAGIFVREHAKAVQLFDDVIVLHLAGWRSGINGVWKIEEECDQTLVEGVPTYHVWYRRSPIPHTSYPLFLGSVFHAIQYVAHQGFRPDIIHAHNAALGLPAILARRVGRAQVIITEHSTALSRGLLSRTQLLLARVALQSAGCVLPVSHSLQRAIEGYGIKARFAVIPNAVDTSLFHPSLHRWPKGSQKRVLFVGLLGPAKGLPYLFQSLALLQRQRNDWHLDVVGDGTERANYEHLVSELRLADKVTFLGLRPKHEVAGLMRQADFFVLPSLWENLPCVLIEAMASGLPVVSTLVGGVPEMIDEDTGILVSPGNVADLVTALAQMMGSLDKYDRAAIAKKAAKYSHQAVGGLIHSVYEECNQR